MMRFPITETSDSQIFILITGANSGLGISIAIRLIDEFFRSKIIYPKNKLTLILSTRSEIKSQYTISRLKSHVRSLVRSSHTTYKQTSTKVHRHEFKPRQIFESVHFLGVEVDLCNLRSVYALAHKLVNGTAGSFSTTSTNINLCPQEALKTTSDSSKILISCDGEPKTWGGVSSGFRLPRIDAILLTAGIGGWKGIAWLPAIKEFLFNTVEAVTWPTYKIAKVGAVLKPQSSFASRSNSDSQNKFEEPPLGEVFCANVFGQYILAHELMPLLSQPAKPSGCGGKIIWVSSLEAYAESFSVNDFQGLRSMAPYESSKRLIDLLVLAGNLPSVEKLSNPFFDVSLTISGRKLTSKKSDSDNKIFVKPKNYLVHPGIFASEIMPVPFILVVIYKLIFYIVRWFGSPWHTIHPYKAAIAIVWLALIDSEELEKIEDYGKAKIKWGSATDASGAEKVVETEVPGWGWDGRIDTVLGEEKIRGRKKDSVSLRSEVKEEFELLSGECWKEIEALRQKFETLLELNFSGYSDQT